MNIELKALVYRIEFQKSMDMQAMLNQMLLDMHKDELDRLNLPAKEHQRALDNIDIFCKIILKDNPLPGINPDALRMFCD